MISKVILTNIKSHLSTELELVPGLNVIGGETDEGKSNVFRAITWALFNKPLGWNPKPWPSLKPKGKESIVAVHFTDGNVVKRIRSFSGKNTYELNGEVLAGLHGKVPEQVEDVVNMNYTNIQHQKDMFFLLDDTPGQVAKEINKVADLEKMDVALKAAESEVKQCRTNIKTTQHQILKAQHHIEQFSWLNEAQPVFDKLEQQESDIIKDKQRLVQLQGDIDQYLQIKQQLDRCASEELFTDYQGLKTDMGLIQKAKKRWNQVCREVETANFARNELGKMMSDPEGVLNLLDSFKQRAHEHENALHRVYKMRETVVYYKGIEDKLRHSVPDECMRRVAKMVNKLEEYNGDHVRLAGLRSLVQDYHDIAIDITRCEAEIHSDQDALETLRGKIIVCPTCRRPVNV